MNFCNLSYEILSPEDYSLKEGKKFIEKVARTCYKSENLINEDSYERFYNMLAENKHFAMFEHYTLYLATANEDIANFYKSNRYSRVVYQKGQIFITTNFRVIYENKRFDDLFFLCTEPTKYHIKRYSVKFVANIGMSREINRHRVNSMAESSTRYCNFSKNKFGNEITVIKPSWYSEYDEKDAQGLNWYCHCIANDNINSFRDFDYWAFAMLATEFSYLNLIKLGKSPDEARGVLPLDLKTELVHTAFIDDWEHFFRLRTSIIAETGKPHRQISEVVDLLYKDFINRNYLVEIKK